MTVVPAGGVGLGPRVNPVDTSSMIDFELAELTKHDDWRTLLNAYAAIHASTQRQEPEFDGWLPRLRSVHGLEADNLPRIHGGLIALGLLKFQLDGRGKGVRYQLSSGSRQILARASEPSTGEATEADGAQQSTRAA